MNDLKEMKLRIWGQVLKDRKAWNEVVLKMNNPCKFAVEEEEEGEEEEETKEEEEETKQEEEEEKEEEEK